MVAGRVVEYLTWLAGATDGALAGAAARVQTTARQLTVARVPDSTSCAGQPRNQPTLVGRTLPRPFNAQHSNRERTRS